MKKPGQGTFVSKIIKYYKPITIAVLLILVSVLAFNISPGMSYRIVTDKPVEDIVVRCIKSKDYLISHNASSYAVTYDTMVVNSNENFSCGLTVSGKPSRLEVYHPTYIFHDEKAGDEVERIINMIPAIDKLQLLERQYLDGYWGNSSNPLKDFGYYIGYACQFSDHRAGYYLKYHSQDSRPDYRELKKKYYEGVKACLIKQEALRHKYGMSPPQAFVDKSLYPCDSFNTTRCKEDMEYRPEIFLEKKLGYLWGEKFWASYFFNEEDKNRAFGSKKTYLALYKDPDTTGGTWMQIDAWSKADIKKKYPDFIIYDDRPDWMSESQKQSYVTCNGKQLHWDIDEPDGWLLDYENGIIKDIICYR